MFRLYWGGFNKLFKQEGHLKLILKMLRVKSLRTTLRADTNCELGFLKPLKANEMLRLRSCTSHTSRNAHKHVCALASRAQIMLSLIHI